MANPQKGSVKDKLEDIKKSAKAMHVGAKKIQAGAKMIQASFGVQVKENAQEFARAVANLNAAVNAQMSENTQYVKNFYG